MKLKKLISSALTCVIITSSFSALAEETMTISHEDSEGTVTVTKTNSLGSSGGLALAQFDTYGRLINCSVGTPTQVTNSFDYDPIYKTKIMSFSDLNTATAVEDFRILGSKTLFVWDGENRQDNVNNLSGASFTNGPLKKDEEKITAENDGSFTSQHIHITAGSPVSDWYVFDFDITPVSNTAAQYDYTQGRTFEARLYNGNSDSNATALLTIRNYKRSGEQAVQATVNGTDYTNLTIGEKYHFIALVNSRDRVVNVTLQDSEGASVLSNKIDFSDTAYAPAAVRLWFDASVKYDFEFDNLRAYEGAQARAAISEKAVREILVDESTNMLDEWDDTTDAESKGMKNHYDEATARQELSGIKAFHAGSGVVWNGSSKSILTNTPYRNASGEFMVPSDELESLLGQAAGSSEGSEVRDGVTYVPVSSFMSGKTYKKMSGAHENNEVYVLDASFTSSDINNLTDFMFFYRPSSEDIMAKYRQSENYKQHPRLLANQADFDRLRQAYISNSNSTLKEWGQRVVTWADYRISKNYTPVYEHDSEGRMSFQRDLAGDMHILAMAYQLTKDTKYKDKAIEELLAVCEFTDFNLRHMLDMSEAFAAVAIGYDWLYNEFTTDQRAKIEKCIYDNGLFFAWEGLQSVAGQYASELQSNANHGTVAAGATTMMALAMLDVYPEESAFIASQAIRAMEQTLDDWNTEMWFEGPGYWELTMNFVAKFIGSLDSVLGTNYGMENIEGLNNAGFAEISLQSPTGIYNYGDGISSRIHTPELMWLADKFDTPSVGAVMVDRYKSINEFSASHRPQGEPKALALLWYDEKFETGIEYPDLDFYSEALDITTSRNTWDSTNYSFFGAKGGLANDPHAQMDAGSFVFESDGVRWSSEIGMGIYDSGYFDNSAITGTRWLYLSCRAEGQSTIFNNAMPTQGEHQLARAEMTNVASGENGSIKTVDMSDVLWNVSSAQRGFFFTDNRRSLVIRDEIKPSADTTLYWNMILDPDVEVTPDGNNKYILSKNNKSCTLEFAVANGNVGTIENTGSAVKSMFDGDENIRPDKTMTHRRFMIPVTVSNGADVAITVKLTPGTVQNNVSGLDAYTNGISSWALN